MKKLIIKNKKSKPETMPANWRTAKYNVTANIFILLLLFIVIICYKRRKKKKKGNSFSSTPPLIRGEVFRDVHTGGRPNFSRSCVS